MSSTKASTSTKNGPRTQAKAVGAAINALLADCARPDLEQRAGTALRRLDASGCNVLVVGEFKKGKSSLVNALVNAPVCPIDDDVATAKPIEVHYAAEPSAAVVYRPEDRGDPEDRGRVRSISFDDIPSYAAEPPTAPDADQVTALRIGLPRQLLSSGLVLVDTPGVGGLGSSHSATTVGALPSADAVLFVKDASQELTATEVEFMRTAQAMCPTLAIALTKIDFYPAWRRIKELDEGHLSRLGINCSIMAVSAPLRSTAIERNDREMNAESGYGELVAYLRDDLAAKAEELSVRRYASAASELLDHLEAQLKTELAVLDDPAESAKLVRQLELAKEQAERLRGQASRWQQTLNDGTLDLVADIEHDLRSRFRDVIRESEQAVDGFDPAKAWDEFEPWLSRRATADVVRNYTFLQQRAVELAAQVSIHFEADHRDIASRLEVMDPQSPPINPELQLSLKMERPTAASQAVSAMRGTSGGMLMLNAFASIAGVALAGPVLVTVGIILGRKSLRDERTRQLAQRRQLAKQTIRKYTDDVTFNVGKDSRDTLRRINRQLRDHFLARAEELTSSTSESLASAQQAIRSSESGRIERRKEVVGLLSRAGTTRQVLATLGAPPA